LHQLHAHQDQKHGEADQHANYFPFHFFIDLVPCLPIQFPCLIKKKSRHQGGNDGSQIEQLVLNPSEISDRSFHQTSSYPRAFSMQLQARYSI
jgi:hypothetical protein